MRVLVLTAQFFLMQNAVEQYFVVGWQLAITGDDHVTQTIVHKKNCGQDTVIMCSHWDN